LGGAVGRINYDAIRLVENIPNRHDAPEPLMEFGIYDDGILYDNLHKKLFYSYNQENRFSDFKISMDVFGKFNATKTIPNMDESRFANIVNKAKQYIHDGDIFQVVLSRKFAFDVNGDNLTLYKTLRKLNPSPYMYHLKQSNKEIIGASPEMLVRITNDKVETFPIAGTRKITDNEYENKRLSKELLNDEKELAEHTMLVDLGRNDIGKVCKYGTVHPESLMKIKRFSHVQHIVTHVVGNLASEKDMFDAFQAVFPAGTVSGAPKVRAMEIIDELEPEARGSYAGAVGYFSYNGCCDFAIAIRSIFIDGNKGFVQSGAGIVSDSIAENEFKETEHKAGAMLQALKEASD
jgi:anthranilate synthase component 1